MDEIWKPIEGHPFYEVSNLGRVRSLPRTTIRSNGVRMSMKGGIRKVTPSGWGRYLSVGMVDASGANTRHLVHRLVALAFLPPDLSRHFTNHKNGVKTDNRLENLEWVTKSENTIHSFRVLGQRTSLPKKPVIIGGVRYGSMFEAASTLGVSAGHIDSSLRKGHKLRGMEVRLG